MKLPQKDASRAPVWLDHTGAPTGTRKGAQRPPTHPEEPQKAAPSIPKRPSKRARKGKHNSQNRPPEFSSKVGPAPTNFCDLAFSIGAPTGPSGTHFSDLGDSGPTLPRLPILANTSLPSLGSLYCACGARDNVRSVIHVGVTRWFLAAKRSASPWSVRSTKFRKERRSGSA